MSSFDFSGTWSCVYYFPSNKKPGQVEPSTHKVVAHPSTGKVVFESVPNEEESYLIVTLSVDGTVLSGSWQQNTSPHGEFQGALYSGVIVLILDPEAKKITGKWAGVGQEAGKPETYTGEWMMEYLGSQA
jgi:hypothetical protein